MARLNDVVADIAAQLTVGKTLNNLRSIACDRWDEVDDDGKYIVGIEGFTRRIKEAGVKTALKTVSRVGDSQTELPFDIPGAVAMDIEERCIRPTRDLTRDEFVRAIELRESGIEADRRKLREWKAALRAADRYWSKNPEWTFGQCLDAIMANAANDNEASASSAAA